MKGKKIIISVLAALFFAFSAIAMSACFQNGVNSNNNSTGNSEYYTKGLRFTLLEDGESYKVSIGNASDYNIIIPSLYEGKPVKIIDDYGFANSNLIESIIIPDSVEIIGESAFLSCSSLENIIIGNNVKRIGENAFFECGFLEEIVIPNSVERIGQYAFYGCNSLSKITLPFVGAKSNGTTNTHFGYIFGAEDYSLNSFYIPSSLSQVIITNSAEIDTYAFLECTSITYIALLNNITVIKDSAFNGCFSLKTIILSDSISIIEDGAFFRCNSINSIFYEGTYDEAVKLNIPFTTYTKIYFNSNEIERNHEHIWGNPKEITPSTCSSYGLSYITCTLCETYYTKSIPLKEHTEVIDQAVVATCTKTGLTQGSHCSTCNEILVKQNVIAAKGHTKVVDQAVAATCTKTGLTQGSHCSTCNEIFVKQNVVAAKGHTKVVDQAVAATCTKTGLTQGSHCSTCNEIFVKQEKTPTLEHNYVDYVCSECDYHYYTEGLRFKLINGNYEVSGYNGSDVDVVIPAMYNGIPVTSIGDSAFNNCTSLTHIIIPNNVTSIGGDAFRNCSSLARVIIGDSVTSISSYAFHGCCSLTSITIPASVTSIGVNIFSSCSSLKSIVVETNNTVYDSRNNCNAIILTATNTVVVGCNNTIIPNDVTCIGSAAFYGCSSLTRITIPDSVTTILPMSFYGCDSLTTIYYTGTEEQWNDIIIYSYNDNLKDVTIIYNYKG